GTMFSYAANKHELLVAIFLDEVDPAVDRALASVPNRPLLDQVVHVFNAIVVHHQGSPGLARVFVKETPFIDGRRYGLSGFMAKLLAGIEELVDRAKLRGELKSDVPSHLLARNLFGLFFQQLQAWLGAPHPKRRFDGRRMREALELQLRGLRRAAAASGRARLPSSKREDNTRAKPHK